MNEIYDVVCSLRILRIIDIPAAKNKVAKNHQNSCHDSLIDNYGYAYYLINHLFLSLSYGYIAIIIIYYIKFN